MTGQPSKQRAERGRLTSTVLFWKRRPCGRQQGDSTAANAKSLTGKTSREPYVNQVLLGDSWQLQRTLWRWKSLRDGRENAALREEKPVPSNESCGNWLTLYTSGIGRGGHLQISGKASQDAESQIQQRSCRTATASQELSIIRQGPSRRWPSVTENLWGVSESRLLLPR